MQHQALGLQRLFGGETARVVSILSGPAAPDGAGFALALAAELARQGRRAWLVECAGGISHRLGCRPLLSWRADDQSLERQVIDAGAYGLIHAPGAMAGEMSLARAAIESRGCDFLLFAGGRISPSEAPLDPCARQTLVLLLGKTDAEAGYALLKALKKNEYPVRVVLLGEGAEAVSHCAFNLLGWQTEARQTAQRLCQNGNMPPVTSSNTLTIAPNLAWVVSRITQKDQLKAAHGGSGEGAEEVLRR
ncbi:MAG: hypothetical protein AB1591_03515 [Pseudomonadota bacterium]